MSQAMAEMTPPAHRPAPALPIGDEADPLALAALLEANGISDQAARRYDAADVFDLAMRLRHQPDHPAWHAIPRQRSATPSASRAEQTTAYALLLYGPVLAALMIVGLIELGWIWAALSAAGVPADAFLIGLIVGSVTSGAVLQALSWRAGMAISQQVTQVLRPLAGFHLRGAALAWVIGAGLALVWPLAPATRAGLLIASALVMGLVIPSGCLVICRRPGRALLALALPFAVAWLGFTLLPALRVVLPWSCWATQIVALLLSLRARLRRADAEASTPLLPAPRAMLFGSLPYLLTGGLPSLCVGLAQLVAWSGIQAGASAGAAFYSAHWLGMLSVALAQGVGEHAIRSLWPTLGRHATGPLHRGMARALAARLLYVGVALGLSALLVLALHAGLTARWPALATALPRADVVPLGVLSYGCFGLGLFACLVPVALARPGLAGLALALGGLSQIMTYAWFEEPLRSGGLLGLAICGNVLLVAALGSWLHLLRRADYTLYRAF